MRTENIFDRLVRVGNPQLFGWGMVLLRVVVGLQFFYAGVSKIGDWSAAGFLGNATGPLAPWFQSMAGNAWVDVLNVWGLLLIGVALILGVAVRPASFAGVVLMALYYMADFVGNTAHGYIDQHIVLMVIFGIFATGGFGHAFGLNIVLLQTIRKPSAVLRWILG